MEKNYYAWCKACQMLMPFDEADKRDEWARKHSTIKADEISPKPKYGPFVGLEDRHRVLVNNVFRSENYTMSHLAEWFVRNEIKP